MHNTQKTTIQGRTYTTIPFGAERQLKLLPGVLRLLAGPAGSLVDMLKGLGSGPFQQIQERKAAGQKVTFADLDASELLGSLHGPTIAAALLSVATELENGGSDLIKELLRDTHRMRGKNQADGLDSCSDDFDRVFEGDLFTMFKVTAWVVKVNYGNFLNSGSAK